MALSVVARKYRWDSKQYVMFTVAADGVYVLLHFEKLTVVQCRFRLDEQAPALDDALHAIPPRAPDALGPLPSGGGASLGAKFTHSFIRHVSPLSVSARTHAKARPERGLKFEKWIEARLRLDAGRWL